MAQQIIQLKYFILNYLSYVKNLIKYIFLHTNVMANY